MRAILAVEVALVLASVSACGSTVEMPPSTLTPAPIVIRTHTPKPTPTPVSFSSDEVLLFTITATVTNTAGASATLRQEVFSPVELDDLPAAVRDEYVTQCDYREPTIDEFGYLRTEITVTDTSPSGASWPTTRDVGLRDGLLIVTAGSSDSAFIGATQGFSARCASVIVFPGHTSGTTSVSRTATSDQLGGWARMRYGFGAYYDDTTNIPVTFSNCTIVLEDAAASSKRAQRWAKQATDPRFCEFGEYEPFER
jgi:hypothetical protein